MKKLLDAGLDSIKFSINTTGKNYELVHGVAGYDVVLNNLKNLYEYRKQTNSSCKIYISIVIIKQTHNETEKIINEVKKYVDDILIVKVRNFGCTFKDIFSLIEIGQDHYSQTYPCIEPFKNLYVSAEGYLLACSFDTQNTMVIADLNTCSVTEAWYGEKFNAFRKRHLAGEMDGMLCYNCLNHTNKNVVPITDNVINPAFDFSLEESIKERIRQIEVNI
jgi:hypothetical protein